VGQPTTSMSKTTSSVSKSTSSVGQTSIKAAGLNMVTQVGFRLITFAMNAFVLRHISREILGLINVRLNLLDDTIMFLSKECFRLACLSHTTGRVGWQKMINLMWLSLPLATLVATCFGWVWTSLLPSPHPGLMAQYSKAVWIVAASGILQMLAEPPWVAAQLMHLVRLRVVMDTVWVLTRVVVLCLAVSYTPDSVVEVWAWGHALAALLYVLGHYLAFYLILKHPAKEMPMDKVSDLMPSLSNFRLDPGQWKVATSFLGQGVVKQLLTEGEKYVMTIFSLLTLPEQGIYDVVANLGSLAARFVFRPVEESSYFFFSQLWVRASPTDQQPEVEKVEQGLHRLLRLMAILGLLVFGLGFSYCHLLLHLYGGNNLTEGTGPDLLRAQCLLILFLAVNGVTECFARSAMTEAEIMTHTQAMTLLSFGYLGLAWLLTTFMGPVGFVFANCANMLVRILLSVRVIHKAFSGRPNSPLEGLVPDTDLALALISGAVCCQLSEIYLYPAAPIAHLSIGLVVGVVLLLSVIVKEDFILAFLVGKFRAKDKVDEEEEEDGVQNETGAEKAKTE